MQRDLKIVKNTIEAIDSLFQSRRGKNRARAETNRKLKTEAEQSNLSQEEKTFLAQLDRVIALEGKIGRTKNTPSQEAIDAYERFIYASTLLQLQGSTQSSPSQTLQKAVERKNKLKSNPWSNLISKLMAYGVDEKSVMGFAEINPPHLYISDSSFTVNNFNFLVTIFNGFKAEFITDILKNFSLKKLLEIVSEARLRNTIEFLKSIPDDEIRMTALNSLMQLLKKANSPSNNAIFRIIKHALDSLSETDKEADHIEITTHNINQLGPDILNNDAKDLKTPDPNRKRPVVSAKRFGKSMARLIKKSSTAPQSLKAEPIGKSRLVSVPQAVARLFQNIISSYRPSWDEKDLRARLPIELIRTHPLDLSKIFKISLHRDKDGYLFLRDDKSERSINIGHTKEFQELNGKQLASTLSRLTSKFMIAIFHDERHPDDFVRISELESDIKSGIKELQETIVSSKTFPYIFVGEPFHSTTFLTSERTDLLDAIGSKRVANLIARTMNIGFITNSKASASFRNIGKSVTKKIFDFLSLASTILSKIDTDTDIGRERQKRFYQSDIVPLLNLIRNLIDSSFSQTRRTLAINLYASLQGIPFFDNQINTEIKSEMEAIQKRFGFTKEFLVDSAKHFHSRQKSFDYDELIQAKEKFSA